MKNLILTLLLWLGLFSGLSAQFVTIPDINFRNALIQRYPSCFNASQQMDTTCSAVVNDTLVSVNTLQITDLDGIQYFDNLQFLDCSFNQLTSLPLLPREIKRLDCFSNLLAILPSLPRGLKTLECSDNQLTSLPVLPSGLTILYCSINQLTSLPILPNGLEDLNCGGNLLTSLPALPSTLQYLGCGENRLTNLPILPFFLQSLSCYFNRLTNLPMLPNSLIQLNCSHNQLTNLPEIPDIIRTLNCESNQLTNLPLLTNWLRELYCSNNLITSLPALPNSLVELRCGFNQLTNLPAFPSRLMQLNLSNNPNLSCIPLLPSSLGIFNFSVAGTAITCLPNYTSEVTRSSTGLILCTNQNQICQANPMVNGKIYEDNNFNGIRDNLEGLANGVPVLVSPNNWINVSDTTYGYLVKLDTLPITNTFTPGVLPYRTFLPSSYTVTTTSLGMLPTSYDFGMFSQPNITDLVTRISTWFIRPGFTTSANVNVENIGTIDQTNASISLEIPNGLTVISVTPANGIVNGNTVTWSGESIGIFERKSYSVSLQVPATMPLGTSLTYTAIALPSGIDFTADNNYWYETVVVRGSYDPNDKQVNKDRLPNNYVAADEEMLYTIRFQNTGTDTAFTVLIRDTLDLQKLDFSTFRVTGGSHALRTNVRERGVVEFVFNNIMLPDSFVNEPLSHGYVQFRIHPKANLPLGTQIKNRAFIYFDFNTPIITNFATTTVGLLSITGAELGAGSLSLYPVPVAEQLTVNFNAVRSGEVRYRLLDLQGRVLQEQQLTVTEGENISTMDMSKLVAGMYVLQVVGEQGSVSQKIVKN